MIFDKRAKIPFLAMMLSACGGEPGNEQDAAPPPPLVKIVTVQGHSVPNIVELPGRIEAVRTAEVRARVDGIVQRRLFEEGADVREGAPLFQIDPREKRAQLQQAQASLQRMIAARQNAAQVVSRYAPLVGRKAISAQENDAAVSELRQADANVAEARATVASAQLQLSYTLVRAPLSGRVGRAMVTEGALVSASSATPMTQINMLDPVYATFSQSSSEIQTLQARIRSGDLRLASTSRVAVRLVTEGGQDYRQVGYIDFADLTVNPETGSQTLRARFPNPLRQLLPGQFVRGRITAGTVPNGISVPQRAVQLADRQGKLLVVGKDSTVAERIVELGAMVDGEWIIRSGLKPGERVIVEGWQKAGPGQKVRAEPVTADPKAANTGAGAPSVSAPR